MEIKEMESKEIWESFLAGCKEKTFLVSWNWGEFQKSEANIVHRLGIYKKGELVGLALAILIKAKRGSFLFIPHGPIVKNDLKREIMEVLLVELKKLAIQEKASFIRISPIWQRSEENEAVFKNIGFRKAPIHMHPEVTWELDISKTEDELLQKMRKTTRYLIRQAGKNNDITIIKSEKIEDLKKFKKVYDETVKRHNFTPFSLRYLENQFKKFSTDSQILIFLGEYNKEVVSSAIVVFWQGIGFYHHGASLSKFNKIPVSYLMQWEAIKEAKNRGCKLYNFWGISEKNWKLEIGNWRLFKHPWAGLSLFKIGFGGYRKEYVKTQDYPITFKYYLNYIIEKARKIKRRL